MTAELKLTFSDLMDEEVVSDRIVGETRWENIQEYVIRRGSTHWICSEVYVAKTECQESNRDVIYAFHPAELVEKTVLIWKRRDR